MKKLFVIGLLALMSFSAGAQIIDLGGGMIIAKQKNSAKVNGTSYDSSSSGPGFYLNAGTTSMLTEGIGYTIDLFLSHWTLTADEEDLTDSKTNENNIGFVYALSFRFPVSESMVFSPYFGPAMMYGLSSKSTGKNPVDNSTYTSNNYDKNDLGYSYSRLDTFITVGAAVDIIPSNLRLSFGVDFGMWNRISGVKDSKLKDGPNIRFGVAYLM